MIGWLNDLEVGSLSVGKVSLMCVCVWGCVGGREWERFGYWVVVLRFVGVYVDVEWVWRVIFEC